MAALETVILLLYLLFCARMLTLLVLCGWLLTVGILEGSLGMFVGGRAGLSPSSHQERRL